MMDKDQRTLEMEALVKAHMPAMLSMADVERMQARITQLEAARAAQKTEIEQLTETVQDLVVAVRRNSERVGRKWRLKAAVRRRA